MDKKISKNILINAWEEAEIFFLIDEMKSFYPEMKWADRYEIAKDTTIEMLRRGWIKLYWNTLECRDWNEVDPSEFEKVLMDKKNWEPPSDGRPIYLIDVTELGKLEMEKP